MERETDMSAVFVSFTPVLEALDVWLQRPFASGDGVSLVIASWVSSEAGDESDGEEKAVVMLDERNFVRNAVQRETYRSQLTVCWRFPATSSLRQHSHHPRYPM